MPTSYPSDHPAPPSDAYYMVVQHLPAHFSLVAQQPPPYGIRLCVTAMSDQRSSYWEMSPSDAAYVAERVRDVYGPQCRVSTSDYDNRERRGRANS